MNKAIKYRLYPTAEQEIMFAKTFGCCRKVYHLMLEDKIKHYKATKETLNNTPNLEIKEALVEDLIVEDNIIKGIRVNVITFFLLILFNNIKSPLFFITFTFAFTS